MAAEGDIVRQKTKEDLNQELLNIVTNPSEDINKTLNIITDLIDAGADVNYVKIDEFGSEDNLLNFAIESKADIEIIKKLVEKGANLYSEQDSPLAIAAGTGFTEAVKYFLSIGMDVNHIHTLQGPFDEKPVYGYPALYHASMAGHEDTVNALLEHPDIDINKCNPLCIAVKLAHEAIVKSLLKRPGINVDQADKYGEIPLYIAVKKGRIAITRLLLEQGANVNVINNKGFTLFHRAISNAIYCDGRTESDHNRSLPKQRAFVSWPNVICLLIMAGAKNLQPLTSLRRSLSLERDILRLNNAMQKELQLISDKITSMKKSNATDNDKVISLRKQLQYVISCKLFEKEINTYAYNLLLNLAGISPINKDDPISQEAISETNKVAVSSGYQFDINLLIQYHYTRSYQNNSEFDEFNDSKWLINPFTGDKFSIQDSHHIQKEAAERGITIRHLKDEIKLPQHQHLHIILDSFFQQEPQSSNQSNQNEISGAPSRRCS